MWGILYIFLNESSQLTSEGRTILWMRRLRHRQFKPLLKTVLLAPSGSGTSARVWVVFQAKAYNSTPGAGRPAVPVDSHLGLRPLLLLVEATKGLVGRSRNHLTSWVTICRGSAGEGGLCSPAGWVRWGSAWLLSRVSSGPPDGTSGPRVAPQAPDCHGSFGRLRFPRVTSLKYLFHVLSCPYLFHSWF